MASKINFQEYQALYVMAARGIQEYLFRSDKQKEMIGASDLVERLATSILEQVLADLCPTGGGEVLSQAGGGARILFKDEQDARNLAQIWPAIVRAQAPGLQVVQAVVPCRTTLGETLMEAERQIAQNRNYYFPPLPPANPLMDRVPRTGQPAVAEIHEPGEKVKTTISLESQRKRDQADETKAILFRKIMGVPVEQAKSLFPEKMDDLAAGENSYVAVIHADGNGMGERVISLLQHLTSPDAPEKYRQFCSEVENSTLAAARAALAAVRENPKGKYPVIPLVCAGDDVTLVMSAPCAMRFCGVFADKFEAESQARLGGLGLPGLADRLTTSIGVAFVKQNYPFAQAYELAESLCAYAKKATGRQGSSVAFYRVTTALAGRYQEEILPRSLTVNDCRLTMNPYALGATSGNGVPSLAGLKELFKAASGLPRGSVREIISRCYQSKAYADQAFERLAEVHEGKKFPVFKTALGEITGDGLWKELDGQPRFCTPLLDVIELKAVKTDWPDELQRKPDQSKENHS